MSKIYRYVKEISDTTSCIKYILCNAHVPKWADVKSPAKARKKGSFFQNL